MDKTLMLTRLEYTAELNVRSPGSGPPVFRHPQAKLAMKLEVQGAAAAVDQMVQILTGCRLAWVEVTDQGLLIKKVE